MHKLIRAGIVGIAYVALLIGTSQATVLSGTVKYSDGTNFNGQIIMQLPASAVRDKCNNNQVITAKSITIPVINGIIQNSNDFVPLDCTDPPTPYDVAYKDKFGSIIFQDRWWVGPPSGITISNVQGDTNIYPLIPDVVSIAKGGYKTANTNVFVGSTVINWDVPFQKQVGTDYIIACNLTDQNATLQINSVLPLSTTQAIVSVVQTNTDCRGCDVPIGMVCRARQTGAGIITSPVVLTATSTTLTANASTANQGADIQFTANVTPTPTGIVNFIADGGISLGLVPVDATGTAILDNNGLQPGTHSVKAFYYGSNLYQSSVSAPVTIQITAAPKTNTTTAITVTPTTAVSGTQVHVQAAVSPSIATGTLTFYDGTTLLATLPVNNGGATYVSTTFANGSHSLTVTYSGDSSFNGSTSTPATLVITLSGGTATTTAVAANPSSPTVGQLVTVTGTVNGTVSPKPTGTAILSDNGVQIASQALSNGIATYSNLSFAVGTHNLQCSYGGDSLNQPSVGALTLNVNSGGTCTFQPTTDIVTQTSNNTSACSAGNLYCNAQFVGMTDTQAGIITPTFNAAPKHVSNLLINTDLYSGNTTKIMAHLMPWFCQPTTPPPGGYNGSQTCGGHVAVGYSSADPNLIAAQATAMQRVGLAGWVMDWYKQHDNVALAWKTYFANNPSSTLVFAMMEDGNGTPKTNCPQNGTDQTTCLTNAFNSDLDYLNSTYLSNAKYDTDGGRPVVYFFVNEASWASPTNWTTVWTNVKAHTNGYSNPPKFIFENASGATHTASDGAFSWAAPLSLANTASQENWNQSYYTGFYDTLAPLYASKLAVGSLKKGFDDFFASWKPSPNRVTGQQCGQVIQFVANQIVHNGDFGTGQQLKRAQLVTWNDYEEGTALEDGVDNCFTVTATSISGTTVNWTLNSISSYSNTSTIDHFDIWLADGSNPSKIMKLGSATNISTSYDFGSACIPTGSWTIYVEMVGRPLILNKMSNGLAYNNQPAAVPTVQSISPNTGPSGGGTAVTITGTNFRTGAKVAIGGPLATNVVVGPASSAISDTFSTGTLGTSKWVIDTGSSPASSNNTGTFSASNVDLSQGMLGLKLVQTTGTPAISTGAEVRSVGTYGYGSFEWVARTSSTATTPNGAGTAQSGSVTGLFNFINTSQTEIDFEVEGQSPNTVEMTNWINGVNSTGNSTLTGTDTGFHDYKYVWSPGSISFYLDGNLVRTSTTNVPTAPAYIMFNHWGTNSATFGGTATNGTRWVWIKSFTYIPGAQTITAVTPPGSNGAATVTVTNTDGTSGSLAGGFTYFTTGQGGVIVNVLGTGQGQIISSPAGIQCPAICSATFPIGTTVTLTESPQ